MALTKRTLWGFRVVLLLFFLPTVESAFAQPSLNVKGVTEGSLNLTPAERVWLTEHPQLRLGVDPAWEPFEFIDAKGNYRGMAAEYMQLLADLLDIRLIPSPGLSWPQVVEAAQRSQLDILPAVLDTPQRREFLTFTQSYLNFPMVIVTRDDALFLSGINDLNGSRVGVVKGYATVDILKTGHPQVTLVEFETLDEGLENLSLGRVDAFVENLASIVSAIKRTGVTNVKVAAPTPYQSSLAIGVRKDWPELVGILNKALTSLSSAQIDEIQQRWIRIKFERSLNVPFALKAGLVAVTTVLLILLVIFIWNRRLVREVERRTRVENTLARRNQILEQLSDNKPLESVLEELVRAVETKPSDMLGSILLLNQNGNRFTMPIAPSLPDFYNEAIDGLEIGEGIGCCGHAAFTGQRTIAEDLLQHPYWLAFRDLVQRTELRACWSQPIRASSGRILGTFALYYKTPCTPEPPELQLIEELSEQAAMAIEHFDNAQSLRRLSQAVEQSPNAVLITAREGKIEYSNPQFSAITGYTAAEVLGQTLHLLQPPGPTHEISHNDLWACIKNGREWSGERQCRHKSGSLYWSRDLVSPIVDTDGTVRHFVWLQEDVTESRESHEQIAYQASHDALTGLMNRHEFERRLSQAKNQAENGDNTHMLCFLDLDQFKIINDTVGHVAGDELLRQISLLLSSLTRKSDCLARFGGDEFAILMENCPASIARKNCEEMRVAIENHRFFWQDRPFNVGASIGLAPMSAGGGSFSDALRHADIACYAAKDAGRNRVHMFEPDDELTQQRSGEMIWVTRISEALENNGFALFVQPVISTSGDVKQPMYEVLLRMHDADGSLIPPGAFLPAAERYNLITRVDRWVVDCLFQWLQENHDKLEHDTAFAINLAGPSLNDDDFLAHLVEKLDAATISSFNIKFEITETAAISHLGAARAFIETLHSYGVEFALDDFGSGLSSFGYLKNLDVQYLKIDGMFVRDMLKDPISAAMVKSINDIGHVMGKKTIAEFVENAQIHAELARMGVDFVQGYGVGMPTPIDELLKPHLALEHRHSRPAA